MKSHPRFPFQLISLALLLTLTLFFSGCETTRPEVGDATARAIGQTLEKIELARLDLETAKNDLNTAVDALNRGSDDSRQFIADRVFSAHTANAEQVRTFTATPYTGSIENHLSRASLLLPPPSPEAQMAIVEELRLALSTAEADRAKLEQDYAALTARAEQLQAEEQTLKAALEDRRRALDDSSQRLQATTGELARQRAEAAIKAAAARDAEHRESKERAARQRMQVATVFMVMGGLLTAAGAVAWFLRVPGVLSVSIAGGATLFAIGSMISYVEDLRQRYAPWFDVAVGLIIAAILGYMVYLAIRLYRTRQKQILDERISNSTIGAIEELKLDDERFHTNHFNNLQPYLRHWHTDDHGDPDRALSREIHRRVVALNLINSGDNPVTTGPVRTMAQAHSAGAKIDSPTRKKKKSQS